MKDNGYIITAPDSTRTSIGGRLCGRDVTDDIFRQAVTSAGMGCMAALEAEKYLATKAWPQKIPKEATGASFLCSLFCFRLTVLAGDGYSFSFIKNKRGICHDANPAQKPGPAAFGSGTSFL